MAYKRKAAFGTARPFLAVMAVACFGVVACSADSDIEEEFRSAAEAQNLHCTDTVPPTTGVTTRIICSGEDEESIEFAVFESAELLEQHASGVIIDREYWRVMDNDAAIVVSADEEVLESVLQPLDS